MFRLESFQVILMPIISREDHHNDVLQQLSTTHIYKGSKLHMKHIFVGYLV